MKKRAVLYRINDYKSFDDYPSVCVMDDLETMTDGSVAEDIIISKITGRNSPYIQEVKGGRQNGTENKYNK